MYRTERFTQINFPYSKFMLHTANDPEKLKLKIDNYIYILSQTEIYVKK